MEDIKTETALLNGGEFLVKDVDCQTVFIVEDMTEEQRMVLDMADDFVNKKVLPVSEQIEKLDVELTLKLMKEAGDLGLLGTSCPEEYGGFIQNFETNMALTAKLACTRSFSLTHGAHTGIGMLPVLYFGTDQQKNKYLPPCITGDKIAAYCLTEPTSGSDALAAKTEAILSDDGKHYIVNGQKMWITNAGFADIFTVFAQVDGDKFTGFVIERDWEGVSLGAEEKKLGIKGSSTRQVFFENVKVPVENLLGEIGKGHKIAFNILNVGRIKLAAGVLGAAKALSTSSITYANERKQFGKTIGNFGAIQYKLAEQAIRIYAVECAMHRAGHDISKLEHKLQANGASLAESLLGAAEEFAIECAILKFAGSECLDYVVDEGLQIYGGMGYSEEMPMASAYRDARINRIFEGTNEINRMLSIDMLLKRVMKGKIDMMSAAMAVQKEMTSMPAFGPKPTGVFAAEKTYVKNLKKLFLAVGGATAQSLMQDLQDEQEVLMNLADMLAELYVCESALLATEKAVSVRGEEGAKAEITMAKVYINDAIERSATHAKNAVSAWADGDTKRMLMLGIKRYTKHEFLNTKTMRREVAAQLLEANNYCFK